MTSDRILIGVDGGNTKTVAIAAAVDGSIVGAGRVTARADIHHVPIDVAVAVYTEAVDRAIADVAVVGEGSSVVAGAAFSLAGADWPEDVAVLEERLRTRWPDALVVNDAIGALRAAVPDGPGVVVVCGTGTATGARGPGGRTWHTGFWQQTQGAHELGVRALQAVYRAELGIDPPTALTDRILVATSEPTVEALLHHASGRDVIDRRDPAVVTPVLLDAADAGDPAALAIVRRHGTELGQTALAAARRAGIAISEPFRLALTGGVLRHPATSLRAAIVETVRIGAPAVELVPPADEPAVGALLLAFDAAGIAVDDAVLERIRSGLHLLDLFDTHPGRVPRR